MKNIQIILLFAGFAAAFSSCQKEENGPDAYGNFEATATVVGAEANGRLLYLNVEEGQHLAAGQNIGLVDTAQLHLQLLQLQATLETLPQKLREAEPEVAVLEDQKRNLIRERDRVKLLLADKAATPKQLDDMNGQIEVMEKRIAAARRSVRVVNRGILSEKKPVRAQMDVLREQLRKCHITNPVSGTVLTKLSEPNEVVGYGSPLYKIADLSRLTLRAYATAVQLQKVKVGQQVKVFVDNGEDGLRELPGEVTWISGEAEFTPKTIQTKEERVNLVYALKVEVANDGTLKIGMPGEVVFSEEEKEE